MAKKTTKQYKEELNKVFPNLKVLSEYNGNKSKIIVEDELGIKYNSTPIDLLTGHYPSISTAISKTNYFITKSNIAHNNIYNYSKSFYKSKNEKVTIICKEHGDFKQLPGDHMKGHGCLACSRAQGSWRKSEWKKKGETSYNFDNYKLYLLKVFNNKESFIKIGITFRKVEDRIKPIKNLYNVEIIDYLMGESNEIYKIEKYLKRQLKNNKYTPNLLFDGNTECFKMETLNKLDLFFKQ